MSAAFCRAELFEGRDIKALEHFPTREPPKAPKERLMLYTVASEQWSADRPLTPAQARVGLFRTRDEASKLAGGRPTLAVAVRYDATRASVVATPPASLRLEDGSWSAPAFVNDSGGLVPLCPIPPALVKLVGPPRFRVHPPQPGALAPASGRDGRFVRAQVRANVAGRFAPRR